jgi:DNA polymerase V
VGPAAHLPSGVPGQETGILFFDLAPAAGVQSSVVLRPDTPERVRLTARVGGLDRGWKLKAELLSQRDTTRWDRGRPIAWTA